MALVTLLTGGDIGDINTNINTVREYISQEIGAIVNCSSIGKSEAWGFKSEHYFLNQVLVVETELTPDEILFKIWDIERVFGRTRGTRSEEQEKWDDRLKNGVKNYKSRAMDIDILYYNDESIVTDFLTIPHREIENREFVKVLLDEIER